MRQKVSLLRMAVWWLISLGLAGVALGQSGWYTSRERYEIFVRIEGIPGEATEDGYQGWIKALAFESGYQATDVFQEHELPRATRTPLRITKPIDRSSPELRLRLHKGDYIASVTIEFTRGSAPDRVPFYRVELENVLVVDLSMAGNLSQSVEAVSFAPGRIKWTHFTLRPDGSTGGSVSSSWDYVTGVRP